MPFRFTRKCAESPWRGSDSVHPNTPGTRVNASGFLAPRIRHDNYRGRGTEAALPSPRIHPTIMKHVLLALSATLVLTSCAGVRVANTQVASGATNPRAIYVRPFDVAATEFIGHHSGGRGERPIRQSLAGREFAGNLKQELEKLAPARVIERDEAPTEGWLVEGSLDVVDGGSRFARALPVYNHLGVGRSKVLIHVRVSEVGGHYVETDKKNDSVVGKKGRVVYEFDLAGGSHASGELGSIYAPGLGYSVPFDFKNAAERVMMALSVDPHHYGVRTSPTIR